MSTKKIYKKLKKEMKKDILMDNKKIPLQEALYIGAKQYKKN